MSFFVSSLSFCPEKTGRLQEPDPASPGRALLCLTARLCHRSRNQTAFPTDCLTVKDKIPCSFMVFEEPALFVFSEESKFCSLEGGFDASPWDEPGSEPAANQVTSPMTGWARSWTALAPGHRTFLQRVPQEQTRRFVPGRSRWGPRPLTGLSARTCFVLICSGLFGGPLPASDSSQVQQNAKPVKRQMTCQLSIDKMFRKR